MTVYPFFDLLLAAVTTLLCTYVGTMMIFWTYRLRLSSSPLKPLIASLILFKFSIASWAAGNFVAMVLWQDFPPFATLIPRIAILLAVCIQARVSFSLTHPLPRKFRSRKKG